MFPLIPWRTRTTNSALPPLISTTMRQLATDRPLRGFPYRCKESWRAGRKQSPPPWLCPLAPNSYEGWWTLAVDSNTSNWTLNSCTKRLVSSSEDRWVNTNSVSSQTSCPFQHHRVHREPPTNSPMIIKASAQFWELIIKGKLRGASFEWQCRHKTFNPDFLKSISGSQVIMQSVCKY